MTLEYKSVTWNGTAKLAYSPDLLLAELLSAMNAAVKIANLDVQAQVVQKEPSGGGNDI